MKNFNSLISFYVGMIQARYVRVVGNANVESVFVTQSVNWNPTNTTPDHSVNAVITTATTTKANCAEVCRRVFMTVGCSII